MSHQLRKQWARLGIAFRETFSKKGCIDLEQLIIETCQEGQNDSRLFFTMRGWLLKHQDLVNISRLIRIVKIRDNTAVLGALIDSIVEEKPRSQLRYILKYCQPAKKQEFVFKEVLLSQTVCQLNLQEALPIWKKWNLISRDMEKADGAISEKGRVFLYNKNLALRAFFGPNTRAEILSYFLQYNEGNAYHIAETMNQSYEPVYSELKLCKEMGFVSAIRRGNAVVYQFQPQFFKIMIKQILFRARY